MKEVGDNAVGDNDAVAGDAQIWCIVFHRALSQVWSGLPGQIAGERRAEGGGDFCAVDAAACAQAGEQHIVEAVGGRGALFFLTNAALFHTFVILPRVVGVLGAARAG